MDLENNLLNIARHFNTCIYLLSAFFLLMRYKVGDRSRLILGISYASFEILMLVCLYIYQKGVFTSKEIMPINYLNSGFFSVLVLFFYPVEVINPGWLTVKRALLILSPWFLLNTLLLTKPDFRQLDSLAEVWQYADEANVWSRLLLMACILSCSFAIFLIPYNRAKSQITRQWVCAYTGAIQGIAVLYALTAFTGSGYISAIHQFYCVALCMTFSYRELFLRLRIPLKKTVRPATGKGIGPNPVGNSTPRVSSSWQDKLQKLMTEQQPWRNPDLTLTELASLLGTNRTTLAILIREIGYDGFNAMINIWRVKAFIQIITDQETTGIYETFFDVGFRSKVTALRYFRQETGMNPSNYLQKVLLKKKKPQIVRVEP